jgi:hypothetical protein
MNIQGQVVAEVYDWPADELWALPEGLANGAYVALYENCHQRIHIIR